MAKLMVQSQGSDQIIANMSYFSIIRLIGLFANLPWNNNFHGISKIIILLSKDIIGIC
jgi:hypothetical protein